MKKVTVYFKSGNILNFQAKEFEIIIEDNEMKLIIENPTFNAWMFDLKEIEFYSTENIKDN